MAGHKVWAGSLGLSLAVAVLGLGFTGCHKAAPKLAAGKPPEVLVDHPTVRTVTDYEDFPGRTEATDTVDIRARVTGYLDAFHFKEGMEVQAGDVLFEIDPSPYEAELERAKANLALAEAHLARMNADYRRVTALAGTRIVSQEDTVKVARAGLRLAELNLGYTKVKAPLSGRISRCFVDPGNLVKADDTVLTRIVALDPIHAYFDIDERSLLRLRRLVHEGRIKSARESTVMVQIGLADEEGFSLAGTIDFADNRLDPGTGSLRVRCLIRNPRQLLSPGLFVRIRLPIGDPHEAVLVPEEALGTDQGQKFVYVVDDKNKVVYRPVKIGAAHEQLRVVENNGLKPDERIVVSGLQRIRPGIEVTPKPVEQAPTASAIRKQGH
jgi:multidrug efflux system membrane fusion protein